MYTCIELMKNFKLSIHNHNNNNSEQKNFFPLSTVFMQREETLGQSSKSSENILEDLNLGLLTREELSS